MDKIVKFRVFDEYGQVGNHDVKLTNCRHITTSVNGDIVVSNYDETRYINNLYDRIIIWSNDCCEENEDDFRVLVEARTPVYELQYDDNFYYYFLDLEEPNKDFEDYMYNLSDATICGIIDNKNSFVLGTIRKGYLEEEKYIARSSNTNLLGREKYLCIFNSCYSKHLYLNVPVYGADIIIRVFNCNGKKVNILLGNEV